MDVLADADTEPPRERRHSVQLTTSEWRDLVLLLQTISMPPARYRRIIDSIQIQTSRIRG